MRSEGLRRLSRLLRAIGPQLTTLDIQIDETDDALAIGELCPAVARCTRLTSFEINGVSQQVSGPLCDALIASGAPLEAVAVDVGPAHGARLLEAIATIRTAQIFCVEPASLSSQVTSRLQSLNGQPYDFPTATSVHLRSTADMRPSAAATVVRLTSRVFLAPMPSLGASDFAAAYPNLKELVIRADVDLSSARFPATLEALRVDFANAAAGTALLRQLATGGSAGLPRLRKVVLQGTSDAALVDIAPLAVFASTLRSFTLRPWLSSFGVDPPSLSESDACRLESTLSQLTGLIFVSVAGLPTARCFLGGNHKRLREVTIFGGRIHAPEAAVPFPALVRACPRLIQGRGRSQEEESSDLPAGWQFVDRGDGTCICRTSFL